MPEVATPNQAEREFETATDEFFKSHSELHAVNAKRTYDEFQDLSLASARRAQSHLDDLNARTLNGLEQLHALQAKINNQHFESLNASQTRVRELETALAKNNDELAYQYRRHSDLSADSYWNPVTAGTGMNITAGGVPANRIVDTTGAVAGGAVNADIAAIAAAVAKTVDATITPMLATLQQVIQALTTATSTIANVVNQVQPKTSA